MEEKRHQGSYPVLDHGCYDTIDLCYSTLMGEASFVVGGSHYRDSELFKVEGSTETESPISTSTTQASGNVGEKLTSEPPDREETRITASGDGMDVACSNS